MAEDQDAEDEDQDEVKEISETLQALAQQRVLEIAAAFRELGLEPAIQNVSIDVGDVVEGKGLPVFIRVVCDPNVVRAGLKKLENLKAEAFGWGVLNGAVSAAYGPDWLLGMAFADHEHLMDEIDERIEFLSELLPD